MYEQIFFKWMALGNTFFFLAVKCWKWYFYFDSGENGSILRKTLQGYTKKLLSKVSFFLFYIFSQVHFFLLIHFQIIYFWCSKCKINVNFIAACVIFKWNRLLLHASAFNRPPCSKILTSPIKNPCHSIANFILMILTDLNEINFHTGM